MRMNGVCAMWRIAPQHYKVGKKMDGAMKGHTGDIISCISWPRAPSRRVLVHPPAPSNMNWWIASDGPTALKALTELFLVSSEKPFNQFQIEARLAESVVYMVNEIRMAFKTC